MTTPSARRRRPLAALAVALLLPVAASACASADEPVATDGVATPSVSATPGGSASPSVSASASEESGPEPENDVEPADGPRPTSAPRRSVDAGTVASGVPAVAQGKGNAEVTFERDGEFAVVAQLDCSACSGATVLTAPERGDPFGESDEALVGDYLMDVFEDSETEQSVWLVADGPWTLRFESWNDLAPVAGKQSGEGSTVLAFGDTASGIDVKFTPAGPDDSFSGRYFSVSGDPLMFGDSEAFSDSYEVSLPGVLAVTTNGSWTVQP